MTIITKSFDLRPVCCSAIVAESAIKSIDVPVKSLGAKRTAGFVRACEELQRHRELLDAMGDDQGGSDQELVIDEGDAEEVSPTNTICISSLIFCISFMAEI